MKYFISNLFFALIFVSVHSQSTFFTGGNICPSSDWSLVFSDEFNGDSIDHTKWMTYWPWDEQTQGARGPDDQNCIFLDSNLVVKDGSLKIMQKHETATWQSATREYTSGLIFSRGEYRYLYGKFEIRCKTPAGKGFRPAFWMFGGNGTEIDAFEIHGETPRHHQLGIIKWDEHQQFFARHDFAYDGIDFSKEFHVYTTEWDPFFISFKVDGKEIFLASRFYTVSGAQVTWCCVEPGVYNVLPAYPSGADNWVSIIANVGIALGDDAPNDNSIFPTALEIDYIRVYQRDTTSSANYDCEVLLYPNPALGKMIVKKNKMNQVRIENVLGEILFSKQVSGNETEVDVSIFSKGIYFVEVESEDGTFASKFIKE